MFDQETWRRKIVERLGGFTRNPRQELQLAGTTSLLTFLATQTIEPFLEAFHAEPVAAVVALAEITRGPGADQLVRRAARASFQPAAQLDRELRGSPELRATCEQLLVELQVVPLARQRLNGAREEWLRATLERDLDTHPGEFALLRRAVGDPGGHARAEALRQLRSREGNYTPADLVLIHHGLRDGAAHVRSSAARLLGMLADQPPPMLTRTLVQVALRDYDAETRFAAARALGTLRHKVTSPQLLDELVERLADEDSFVRSAAALTLAQLGDVAANQRIVAHVAALLEDPDAYTREAAARALGGFGSAAATPEALLALSRAAQDGDIQVHEAASDSLTALRALEPSAGPRELAAAV